MPEAITINPDAQLVGDPENDHAVTDGPAVPPVQVVGAFQKGDDGTRYVFKVHVGDEDYDPDDEEPSGALVEVHVDQVSLAVVPEGGGQTLYLWEDPILRDCSHDLARAALIVVVATILAG